jgi:hypothetical protein
VGFPGFLERSTNGAVTMYGSGGDIWQSSDQFFYLNHETSGNGVWTVKVEQISHTNDWAKAGIMLRDSTAANAKNVMIAVSPNQGIAFQWRQSTGGSSSSNVASNLGAPRWLRLTKSGTEVKGYYSSNGTSWTLLGTRTWTGSGVDLIGLAVSSRDNSKLAKADFTNISGFETFDVTADIDGDGLNAGEEWLHGTSDQSEDSDGDGLNDATEVQVHGTDPADDDSDDDQLKDGWEIAFGLQPNNGDEDGNLQVDGLDDWDLDGLTNVQEQSGGTDPNDYYNGEVPTLTVTPSSQSSVPGMQTDPYVVGVGLTSGTAVNAPITLTVTAGTGTLQYTGPLRTGTGGQFAFSILTGTSGETTEVEVSAGTAEPVTVTATPILSIPTELSWPLDENTGTTINEAASQIPAGTWINGPHWTTGPHGDPAALLLGATSEGGANECINLGSPASGALDFGNEDFTVMLWVKFTDVNVLQYGRRIVSKGHHGWNPGYFIATHGTGKIDAGIGSTVVGNAEESLMFRTNKEFNDGKWHHIAVVFDQTNGHARIYVDGVPEELFSWGGSGCTISSSDPTLCEFSNLDNLSATRSDTALTIGSHAAAYDFFKGAVDDLRFYRFVLSPSEISAIALASDDADNLPDGWEQQNFGDLDETDGGDFDSDGVSNLNEYLQGRDPTKGMQAGTANDVNLRVFSPLE